MRRGRKGSVRNTSSDYGRINWVCQPSLQGEMLEEEVQYEFHEWSLGSESRVFFIGKHIEV